MNGWALCVLQVIFQSTHKPKAEKLWRQCLQKRRARPFQKTHYSKLSVTQPRQVFATKYLSTAVLEQYDSVAPLCAAHLT